MPKKSTILKKQIRSLEAKLAALTSKTKKRGAKARARTARKKGRAARSTPVYCDYDCDYDCGDRCEKPCRRTIRERCCDDTCYGGYGRVPCYDDCGPCGPYYGCLPGPYPWLPAPYPTFPPVTILPGATLVETSCLPIY
jgi:hypothetical protein